MKLEMKQKVSAMQERLMALVERADRAPQYFARVVVPFYQRTQAERWQTENASMGSGWKKLSPDYAKAKLSRFKSYPGAGTKLMVATNRLADSILGQSKEYRQVIGDRKMVIATIVPYAQYANDARDFTKFSAEFYRYLGQKYKDYVQKGD